MAAGSFICDFDPTIDLTVHDSTDESPLEDFITFFMRAPFNLYSSMRITVWESVTDRSSYATTYLTVRNTPQSVSTLGLASILEVDTVLDDLLNRDRFAQLTDADRINAQLAEKDWILALDDWQYFAVPKRQFYRQGGFDWTTVEQFQIILRGINDEGYAWISDLLLVGGGKDDSGAIVTPPGANGVATRGGMQGTYKYRITYLNDDTGNRSNPGEAIKQATNVNRGYVTLSNLPTSADPQVTHVEIWRTVGNGDRYFLIGRVTNGTATYDDQVADHDILDSREGVAIMSTIELPEDNDRPYDTFDNVLIDNLTAFWLSNETGQQGRVYYSPLGRPESLKGFINVAVAGDPLHRLVLHQGQRFVFSESKLYRVDGQDPYVGREVTGVPGLLFAQRRTVVSTPYGICYQSQDGIRVFNQLRSTLLNFGPIGRIFRGETQEGVAAFEGIVATYARDEYIVSDGNRTLAINLGDLSWRLVGFNDVTALFYEWDTDKIVGGRTSNTQLLEEEGVTADAGGAISFEWETPAIDGENDKVVFLDRVFVDIDAGGATVTPTVTHRFTQFNLTAISDSVRIAREFSVERLLLKPALRLAGSSTSRVVLYNVEFDYRELVLGVNIFGRSERNAVASARATVPGRYREGTGNGEIVFEIPGKDNSLDMTDRIFVLDRLTIEADTDSTDIIPTIRFAESSITLATLNNAGRGIEVYEIDRIGNLEEVILQGDFFTGLAVPTIWRLELHMRELELGMTVTTAGQRIAYPARSESPDTEITFEVPPNRREFDNLGTLYWIERIVIEADTNGSEITVVIDTDGASFTAGTVNTTTRSHTEIFVQRPGPIRNVRLQDDFTDDVQLFGVEVMVRPVNFAIQTWSQQRVKWDGKVVAPGTEVVFDIDPDRHELDGTVNVPMVEWLYLDINTNGADVRPRITTEFGDIVMSLANTEQRCTLVYDLHEIGNIQQVDLEADYINNAIELYGCEVILGSLDLGIRVLEGGEGAS